MFCKHSNNTKSINIEIAQPRGVQNNVNNDYNGRGHRSRAGTWSPGATPPRP